MSHLPGLFTPVTRGGITLADGGVLNPLPVDVARTLGPRVVAVDVLSDRPSPEAPQQLFESRGPMRYATEIARRLGLLDLTAMLLQAAGLMTHRLAEYSLHTYPPDVLLQPRVGHVGLFAFDLAPEAYRRGEDAAQAALPQLEALARPRLLSAASWRMQIAAASRQRRARKAAGPQPR